MSGSNQHYKELAIPYFSEVFELIDDVLNKRELFLAMLETSPFYPIVSNIPRRDQ